MRKIHLLVLLVLSATIGTIRGTPSSISTPKSDYRPLTEPEWTQSTVNDIFGSGVSNVIDKLAWKGYAGCLLKPDDYQGYIKQSGSYTYYKFTHVFIICGDAETSQGVVIEIEFTLKSRIKTGAIRFA